jgi:hypothetical protein
MLINDLHLKTSLWYPTDEAAINVYTPQLENVTPGQYSLFVIVYNPDPGHRLPVGAGDAFLLGKVQVVPNSPGTATH